LLYVGYKHGVQILTKEGKSMQLLAEGKDFYWVSGLSIVNDKLFIVDCKANSRIQVWN